MYVHVRFFLTQCIHVNDHDFSSFNYPLGFPVIVGLDQTQRNVTEGTTAQCCVEIMSGTATMPFVVQFATVPVTATLCNA